MSQVWLAVRSNSIRSVAWVKSSLGAIWGEMSSQAKSDGTHQPIQELQDNEPVSWSDGPTLSKVTSSESGVRWRELINGWVRASIK